MSACLKMTASKRNADDKVRKMLTIDNMLQPTKMKVPRLTVVYSQPRHCHSSGRKYDLHGLQHRP